MSVVINGTLEGKYRAGHLVIEQVEIFKNGGPVSIFQYQYLIYFYFCRSLKAGKC